jgi:hypothetical protein
MGIWAAQFFIRHTSAPIDEEADPEEPVAKEETKASAGS